MTTLGRRIICRTRGHDVAEVVVRHAGRERVDVRWCARCGEKFAPQIATTYKELPGSPMVLSADVPWPRSRPQPPIPDRRTP